MAASTTRAGARPSRNARSRSRLQLRPITSRVSELDAGAADLLQRIRLRRLHRLLGGFLLRHDGLDRGVDLAVGLRITGGGAVGHVPLAALFDAIEIDLRDVVAV